MPVFRLVTEIRKQQPPLLRSKLVKVPASPAGTEAAPIVENVELSGTPRLPSAGAVAFRLQFVASAVVVEPRDDRWMLYVLTELVPGAVKVMRTSSAVVPPSKLPVAAATSDGAFAPLLTQMLNVEMPAGFGS